MDTEGLALKYQGIRSQNNTYTPISLQMFMGWEILEFSQCMVSLKAISQLNKGERVPELQPKRWLPGNTPHFMLPFHEKCNISYKIRTLLYAFTCLSIVLNTLRPRQNGRHFTDDISKCLFLNENAWIAIKISLRIVPRSLINNIPALV